MSKNRREFMIQNNLMADNDDFINLFPMKDVEYFKKIDNKWWSSEIEYKNYMDMLYIIL